MHHIFHPLLLTLIHSLWQSALMAMVLLGYQKLVKNTHPLVIRRLAGLGILSQFILSTITFLFLSWKPESGLAIPVAEFLSAIPAQVEFFASWIYITVSFSLILRTLFNWLHFRKTVKTSYLKAPVDIRLFASQASFHLGIKRKVQVFLSEKIATPVTFGFFRPIILLPVALINQLSIKEAETIILHELEHIRSLDYVLNWIAIFAENLFFFNPFIYYLASRLRQSRERSCDALVLDYNYNLTDYALALYKAASLSTSKPAFVLALSGKKPAELKNRILEMRDHYPAFRKRKIRLSLSVAIMLSLTALWFATSYQQTGELSAFNINNSDNTEFTNVVQTVPFTQLTDNKGEQSFAAQISKPKGLIGRVREKKTEIEIENLQAENTYPVINVSQQEVESPKEITIREEDAASGMVVTSHYLLVADSGSYKMKLLWKIEESHLPDSLVNKHGDSSVIYIPQPRFEQ